MGRSRVRCNARHRHLRGVGRHPPIAWGRLRGSPPPRWGIAGKRAGCPRDAGLSRVARPHRGGKEPLLLRHSRGRDLGESGIAFRKVIRLPARIGCDVGASSVSRTALPGAADRPPVTALPLAWKGAERAALPRGGARNRHGVGSLHGRSCGVRPEPTCVGKHTRTERGRRVRRRSAGALARPRPSPRGWRGDSCSPRGRFGPLLEGDRRSPGPRGWVLESVPHLRTRWGTFQRNPCRRRPVPGHRSRGDRIRCFVGAPSRGTPLLALGRTWGGGFRGSSVLRWGSPHLRGRNLEGEPLFRWLPPGPSWMGTGLGCTREDRSTPAQGPPPLT